MADAFSIWRLLTSEVQGAKHNGEQAGYDAAKALAVASGGMIQVGPGGEALVLGTFPASKVSLVRVLSTGRLHIGGLTVADNQDPLKRALMDMSGLTSGVERTYSWPDWTGVVPVPVDFGGAGKFLKSNGAAQPTWADVILTNALLDGLDHTDTVAKAAARGALIFGNSTPAWDRLTIGAANTVLTSNGTDVSWSLNPAIQHDTLSHIQPFSAANCNWTGSVTRITTSANAFANVKVGDFVYVAGGLATNGNQGRRVASWTDANTIDVDTAKTGSDLVNGTIIFVPGDHWNDAIGPDASGTGVGYMLATGRGTFVKGGPGTTFQELRGPLRWLGHANGSISTDFRVQGSTSGAGGAYFGFSIWKSTTAGVYFMVNNVTTDRVLTVADISGEIIVDNGAQTISGKTHTTGNILRMDETGAVTNGTAFRDRTGTTKGLGFDLTGITAGQNRVAKWQDLSPGGYVEYDYTARVTAIDGKSVATTNLFTVPSGKSFICTRCIVRVTAATAITVGPTVGVGVAAGEDDIIASTALTGMTATDTFTLMLPKTGAVVATSTQVIKLGVDVGATGTSMTLAVDIAGYLV